MYLDKWCSDLFYSTRFFNCEVSLFKFTLFEMVNLKVQEASNESNKINRYITCQDALPRNYCAKPQGQRVDGFYC